MCRETWGEGASAEVIRLSRKHKKEMYGPASSGMSKVIRNALLLNEDFLETITDVEHFIVDQWRSGRRKPIWVSVACMWGKHRSVGLVEELSRSLVKRGFHTIKIHLERPCWDRDYRSFGNWLWWRAPSTGQEMRQHAAVGGFPLPVCSDGEGRVDKSQRDCQAPIRRAILNGQQGCRRKL